MGITIEQAVLLESWSRRHALGGRVTTLGVQHLDFSRRDLDIALGRTAYAPPRHESNPGEKFMSAAELFASLGFENVTAIDVSNHEGADVTFDLNSAELPSHLIGTSELVVNGGTLEHIFHVPNALTSMTRMLVTDGCILHIMPCHNCVDHGFYQFGPTLVFDYYAAARFDILESAAVMNDTAEGYRRGRVVPVPEGALGTGMIGTMASASPLLHVALVRKTMSAIERPIPTQRLYAEPAARRIATPAWFAPFSLVRGERPCVTEVREVRLGPFTHLSGFGWTCALPDLGSEADSMSNPIRSQLVLFEDALPLGPPHSDQNIILAHGRGAYSHWGDTLMISTSDGSDPRGNGRHYTARMPVLASTPK